MNYIVFTDGASKGNPGPGGFGSITASENHVIECGGREDMTTNNRMELQAAIAGLSAVSCNDVTSVTVYCDSSYVINGITKWVHGWQKKDWKTISGSPVLNEDLWKTLFEMVKSCKVKVQWKYVSGHVGVAGNERVDDIASAYAQKEPIELYNGPREGYAIDLTNLNHDADLQSSKSATRTHSKAKAYSYVSEVGGVVLTHKTWAECEARVKGQKARYKKAVSASDEQSIIKSFSKH